MKQNTDKERELGTKPVGRLLLQMSLPAIAAQIINVLYNIVDRMYIGHIPVTGAMALTGVGVTMPLIMAISAFAALAAMGSAPRASIMMGKGRREEAEEIMNNSFSLLVILAVILTIVIQLFGKQLLLFFGASSETIGYAFQYMQIYSMGTIFVQLALGLNAFITAQGFTKVSMMTVMIGAVLNIVLDPVLIFGMKMGVRGAALATIISQCVSSVWVIHFLSSKKTLLRMNKNYFRLRKQVVLPGMALGISPFIMQFTESILSICFNTSLLKYGGNTAVGAMTILNSVMMFSMLPLQGLTQGGQPIISFNYGAGNLERVSGTFRCLLVCCVGYSTLIWAVSMFLPNVIIHMFTTDPTLASFTVSALRVYMAVSLMFGAQIACQQTFIALGNAKKSIFLALLRKVFLLIPLIYILPNILDNQAMAVFLAEPIADFCAVSTTVVLFIHSFRAIMKNNKMECRKK